VRQPAQLRADVGRDFGSRLHLCLCRHLNLLVLG
jgi:hypothetical protein